MVSQYSVFINKNVRIRSSKSKKMLFFVGDAIKSDH